MEKATRLRALVLGLSLAAGALPMGGAARAGSPTHCTFAIDLSLSPGLSVVPGSGDFDSGGETGTVSCDGVVRGLRPTGPGTLGVIGRYGVRRPASCLDGDGAGRFSFTFPTATGPGKRSNTFSVSFGLVHALTTGAPGSFSGNGFSGTVEVRPREGNCFLTPLTKVSVRGQGTITDQHPS